MHNCNGFHPEPHFGKNPVKLRFTSFLLSLFCLSYPVFASLFYPTGSRIFHFLPDTNTKRGALTAQSNIPALRISAYKYVKGGLQSPAEYGSILYPYDRAALVKPPQPFPTSKRWRRADSARPIENRKKGEAFASPKYAYLYLCCRYTRGVMPSYRLNRLMKWLMFR